MTTHTPNIATPMPIDTHRANWWTGLRTMWSRAGTSLRTRKRNFTPLTCMRRKRERLDSQTKAKKNRFTLKCPIDEPFEIINPMPSAHVDSVRGIYYWISFKRIINRRKKIAIAWMNTNSLNHQLRIYFPRQNLPMRLHPWTTSEPTSH